jgi:two-component system response regulator YesN
MRILVVDDERKTREGIIRLVNKLGSGFTVIGEAENGREGIVMIKGLSPDVVITDIMMPCLNGLEMIADAQVCSPDTKFLILSGYAQFELARQAIKLAVADYLLKPITMEELHAALLVLQKKKIPKGENPVKQEHCENQNYSNITAFLLKEIEERFASYLYLDDLARIIGITPEYAGNVFSRETGKSFNIYLRDVRMRNAKELLETSNDKIYEIAIKTGYSDAKYFCRVFKECTGVPAKAYRRLIKLQT